MSLYALFGVPPCTRGYPVVPLPPHTVPPPAPEPDISPTPQPVPAALTASRVVLRILLILNWVYGAAILTLLIATVTNEIPVMTALGAHPSPATPALIQGLRAIGLLGLVSVPRPSVLLRRPPRRHGHRSRGCGYGHRDGWFPWAVGDRRETKL